MNASRDDEVARWAARDSENTANRDAGLSPEELEAEDGAALPDREAMSVISANVDIPANPAIAADVLAGELDDPAEQDGVPDDET